MCHLIPLKPAQLSPVGLPVCHLVSGSCTILLRSVHRVWWSEVCPDLSGHLSDPSEPCPPVPRSGYPYSLTCLAVVCHIEFLLPVLWQVVVYPVVAGHLEFLQVIDAKYD